MCQRATVQIQTTDRHRLQAVALRIAEQKVAWSYHQRYIFQRHHGVAARHRHIIYTGYRNGHRRYIRIPFAIVSRIGKSINGVLTGSEVVELAVGIVGEAAIGIERNQTKCG